MAAPSTTPVARSRPRSRCTPIRSIVPAPAMPRPTKPATGVSPISSAPDPPAAETSPSACPAKDWPRMTVNTPTTAATTATTPPTATAMWTCGLLKNPGSNTADSTPGMSALLGGGDHQHPAAHLQHLDRVPVQAAEHLGLHHLGGRPADRPAAGQVDDPVHHRQQWVHLVRGQQHPDLLFAGDPGEQLDDLLPG